MSSCQYAVSKGRKVLNINYCYCFILMDDCHVCVNIEYRQGGSPPERPINSWDWAESWELRAEFNSIIAIRDGQCCKSTNIRTNLPVDLMVHVNLTAGCFDRTHTHTHTHSHSHLHTHKERRRKFKFCLQAICMLKRKKSPPDNLKCYQEICWAWAFLSGSSSNQREDV